MELMVLLPGCVYAGLWAYGHHPRVLPRRRRGPAAAAGHRPGPRETVRSTLVALV
jgi:hypothetical protein